MDTEQIYKSLNIYAALASAQAKFEGIEKKKTARVRMKSGGEYTYKYADLADVLSSVRKHLGEFGLSVSQSVETGITNQAEIDAWVETAKFGLKLDGDSQKDWLASLPACPKAITGTPKLVTHLFHRLGEKLRGEVAIVMPEGDHLKGPQAYGAALTYARRYGLCNMLGISADEDTDGRASDGAGGNDKKPATGKETTQAARNTGGSNPPKTGKATAPQVKRLFALGGKSGMDSDTVKAMCQHYFKKKPDELTKLEIQKAFDYAEGYQKKPDTSPPDERDCD